MSQGLRVLFLAELYKMHGSEFTMNQGKNEILDFRHYSYYDHMVDVELHDNVNILAQ